MDKIDALTQKIAALAEPVLRELGLELVDLEISRQGSKLWLRFFVDRVAGGGVTVNECGEFNLAISRLLDVEDVVPETYMLEVSSPGLNRRVRRVEDWNRFAGREVLVALREPVDGRRKWKGKIVGADDREVTLEAGGARVALRHDIIARANLEWDEKRK